MEGIRPITLALQAQPTIEGAGVHVKRGFGHAHTPIFDPFLLFDDFSGDDPQWFLAGFPWHPHRGIETITYMLQGVVEHGDSLGHGGTIGAGDVQWMTAGSGIIHQEMPQGERLQGFQLWANLPSAQKLCDPQYRDILSAQIPEAELGNGARMKLICGHLFGIEGPVKGIAIDPLYADFFIPQGSWLDIPLNPEFNAFAYIVAGSARFGPGSEGYGYAASGLGDAELENPAYAAGHVLRFGEGNRITVAPAQKNLRFLLIAGRPLGEPVAWAGPIVMNSQQELQSAFDEYRGGTFLRHAAPR